MRFPNFIGGSHESQSPIFDCQRTTNYYLEIDESGAAKNKATFYRTPGTQLLGSDPDFSLKPARGSIEVDGHYYRVNGDDFIEVSDAGKITFYGHVAFTNTSMAVLAANSNGQIGISSCGEFYCFDTNSSILTPIPMSADFIGADSVVSLDGYFIVLSRALSQFQITTDGLVWSAADVSGRIPMVDSAVQIYAAFEVLWVFTGRQCQHWVNTGNVLFPFLPNGGALMEMGCGAVDSIVEIDNSLMWIGQDTRGGRVAYRAQGTAPVRVSIHSFEYQWSKYSTVADAVAFPYQYRGHTFYQVTFPTADKTALFDAASKQWTDATFTDALGNPHARLERDHAYVFNKHVCGTGNNLAGITTGIILELTSEALDDVGYPEGTGDLTHYPIVRDRICPHLSSENKVLFYSRLELEYQRGIGLDGATSYQNPVFMLRWSDDGGRTWGNEIQLQSGALGQYSARAFLERLGSGRDRVFWIRCSDPVDWVLIDAYIEFTVGNH